MISFAHQRIDHWLQQSHASDRDDYPAAVALLRAVYDMVDRVKEWEAQLGRDGGETSQARWRELEQEYDTLERGLSIPTGMGREAKRRRWRLPGWSR